MAPITLNFGEYQLVKVTNVPTAADYPGVIPLYDSQESERYVLVLVENVQHQLGRYQSFLGGFGEVFDPAHYGGVPHIMATLVARLSKPEEYEAE